MPYIILLVIIVIAAGALLLFQSPETEPVAATEEARIETEVEAGVVLPEGYTPPTEQPPSDVDLETEIDTDVQTDNNALDVSSSDSERDFDPVDDQRVFTAESSYFTPRRTEHDIEVTLTLKDRVVVDANVLYDGSTPNTPAHSGFDSAYKSEVIGKRLNEIELSRTGGASLTSVAFNEAVASIRAES